MLVGLAQDPVSLGQSYDQLVMGEPATKVLYFFFMVRSHVQHVQGLVVSYVDVTRQHIDEQTKMVTRSSHNWLKRA